VAKQGSVSDREEAAADRQPLPPELPEGLAGDATEEAPGPSLIADIEALIADGRTYIDAELGYQKSRAGFAANRLKYVAIYGAAAFAFLHLALIALTVGLVFALSRITGPWIATGIVVLLLSAGAVIFGFRLRGKLADIRAAFEETGS
jgi:hypothetical protein